MTMSARTRWKSLDEQCLQRAVADLTGTAASQDRRNSARSRTRRRATRMALHTAASPRHAIAVPSQRVERRRNGVAFQKERPHRTRRTTSTPRCRRLSPQICGCATSTSSLGDAGRTDLPSFVVVPLIGSSPAVEWRRSAPSVYAWRGAENKLPHCLPRPIRPRCIT